MLDDTRTNLLLRLISNVEWEDYPRPLSSAAGAVADALRDIVLCRELGTISNRFLYAVGNNHRGTYYPVVLPAIDILARVIRDGVPGARTAAAAVLSDLISFGAERDDKETAVWNIRPNELDESVHQRFRQLTQELRVLVAAGLLSTVGSLPDELIRELESV